AVAPGNRVPSRGDNLVRPDPVVRDRLPDAAPRQPRRRHGELLQVPTSPPAAMAGSRPAISAGPIGRPPRPDARPLDGCHAVPHGRDDPHDDPRTGPWDPRRAAARRAAGRYGADDLGRPPGPPPDRAVLLEPGSSRALRLGCGSEGGPRDLRSPSPDVRSHSEWTRPR